MAEEVANEALPDDRKLWCGNIPSRISVGELKAIMLEALCVDVTILAKGPICRRRQWAIVVFESASAAQAFRMQYDGQSIPELYVPGNRFQVAPLYQKIVRRPVLIPPIVNRPQRQHCISAAALLLPPEAIGCPRFKGTVLASVLEMGPKPPGHPPPICHSPARLAPRPPDHPPPPHMQIPSNLPGLDAKSKGATRPKLDEPKLQEYLVPVANPASPTDEVKAGRDTIVIEIKYAEAAVETVAPEETEVKHEEEHNSPATECGDINVSQWREAGIKTESEEEVDTEVEAEETVAPEKIKKRVRSGDRG